MLVGNVSPAEQTGLLGSLGRMDPAILRLMERNGVRFGVARLGEDFSTLGVQTPWTEPPLATMQAAADRAIASTAELDQRVLWLQAEQAALGPAAEIPLQPFPSTPPPLDSPPPPPPPLTDEQRRGLELGMQLNQLSSQRRSLQMDAVGNELFNPPVIPFTLPRSAPPANLFDMAHEIQEQSVKSTNDMARLVGARAPEQVAEYNRLVEGINGERLTEARSASMRFMEERLSTLEPGQRQQAEEMLARWREDPTTIPIDATRHNIFVPNLFYGPDGQRMNLHDATSLLAWTDDDGRVREDSQLAGQYFRTNRRVLVSERSAVGNSGLSGDVGIHEAGHAVDHLVRDLDPTFYQEWQGRLREAHEASRGSTVTDYAGTNPSEYIAEGISHYYADPLLLRSTDPALYSLTEELLHRAAELGR